MLIFKRRKLNNETVDFQQYFNIEKHVAMVVAVMTLLLYSVSSVPVHGSLEVSKKTVKQLITNVIKNIDFKSPNFKTNIGKLKKGKLFTAIVAAASGADLRR